MLIKTKDGQQVLQEVQGTDFKDGLFTFSDNVHVLDTLLFSDNLALKELTLPESVVDIKGAAFKGCINLTAINLDNLITIGCFSFNQCTSLESLSLKRIEHIGMYAFSKCERLKDLNLNSEALTILETGLLSDCTSLKTLVLSGSIIDIRTDVFHNCNGLERIIIDTKDNAVIERIKELLPEFLKSRVIPMTLLAEAENLQELAREQFELACKFEKWRDLPLPLIVKHINNRIPPRFETNEFKKALSLIPFPMKPECLALYKIELELVAHRYSLAYKMTNYLRILEKIPAVSLFFENKPGIKSKTNINNVKVLLKKLIGSLQKGELCELNNDEKELVMERNELLKLIPERFRLKLGFTNSLGGPTA